MKEQNFLWLIIASIFIGFFLQAATKWAKEHLLYQCIWHKIEDENPRNFKAANDFLRRKNLLSTTTNSKRLENTFFTMDNYLSLTGGGRLLVHFASRLAYWSNLFWVSLIILILSLFHLINDMIITISALAILVLSLYETLMHLKNHYDILLKSFTSYVKIDKD